MADETDYEVGYGKPPKATRFQPGRSGNPKGRPKGSLNLQTILDRAMQEKVAIKVNGVSKMLPKMEVAITQMMNKAAGGDLKALREVVGLRRLVGSEPAAAVPEEARDNPMDDGLVLAQLAARLRNPHLASEPPMEEPA